MSTNPTWYVVTAQGRRVLAVYGAALKAEAEAKAKEWRGAWVETVHGTRPSVGAAV